MKRLEGKNILIVDDEDLLREILMEDLTACGAQVVGVENGNLAFELIKKQKFDAIVTDVRMPGGNGVALIKNINAHFHENKPKIFICSGYNDVTIPEVEALSVAYTFNKPFDRESFIQTLAEYLKN